MSGEVLVLDDWDGRLAAAVRRSPGNGLADAVFADRPLLELSSATRSRARVVVAIRERTTFDHTALSSLPRLELVLQTGTQVAHIDGLEISQRGVAVAHQHASDAVIAAVTELTFALAVAARRRLPAAVRAAAAGARPPDGGRMLRGGRLGIVGLGAMGSSVAELGRALGMDVVAWGRPGQRYQGGDPPRLPLGELLATSDVVSIHARLSEATRHLIDRDGLRGMKPGAVLVNTARGAIVDQDALVTALREGPLSAAGLDVTVGEPLPPGHELWHLPNVVLTPHIGWTVDEVFEGFALTCGRQLADYRRGVLPVDELAFPPPPRRPRDGFGGVAGPAL